MCILPVHGGWWTPRFHQPFWWTWHLRRAYCCFLHLPLWRRCYLWDLLFIMFLLFLCLACVNQTDDVIHISLPATQVAIPWCCGAHLLLQVLQVHVHNKGGYWASLHFFRIIPSETSKCLQYLKKENDNAQWTQSDAISHWTSSPKN